MQVYPTINLVDNGIFPIRFDENGQRIITENDTGLGIPGTLQGEGKLVGTPILLVRTSGCNLRCAWFSKEGKNQVCDTPYSSFNPEKNIWDNDKVVRLIKTNLKNSDVDINNVVITGGEPMLQSRSIANLLELLKNERPDVHITLETNGTIFDEDVAEFVDLFSISPKLKSSTPWKETLEGTGVEFNEKRLLHHERFRKNLKVIQAFIDFCYDDVPDRKIRKRDKDFQLKFVSSDLYDEIEIKEEYLPLLRGVLGSDIFLMPLGLDPETLAISSKFTLEMVIKNNWRFSPRLQVDLFGQKRNV